MPAWLIHAAAIPLTGLRLCLMTSGPIMLWKSLLFSSLMLELLSLRYSQLYCSLHSESDQLHLLPRTVTIVI